MIVVYFTSRYNCLYTALKNAEKCSLADRHNKFILENACVGCEKH